MTRTAPAWLADFQARFGEALRTPLDRSTGTLTASTSAYDAALVTDVEKLAVYNRQYWFRLFDALQNAFPLTARLMGYWSFNEVAARYLLAHPPRGWDIEGAADAFEAFAVADRSDEALTESVRIDAAYRDVFRAPITTPFRPSAADAAQLVTGHLVVSPALRVVEERWPLIALRRQALGSPAAPVALPEPLAHPQSWAILRTSDGTAAIPLEPREAELIVLLGKRSVGDALGRIERACSPEERLLLPERVRTWLARSIERGFWCGLRAQSQTTQL